MVITQLDFDRRDLIDLAIERLRQFEPPEGYYLAFSGGKDSITVYRLAELAGVRFDTHYNDTTVDPPELRRFIREHYPDVQRHKPERSMFQLILDKRWPPMRQRRWCCEKLKERGGAGRVVLTGVRWAESVRRRRRRMIEACYRDKSKTYLHPIIDWSDADVWQFIRSENLPYCALYDEGFTRIGCVLCPNEPHPQRHIARWPKFARAYIRTFDRLIKLRNQLGLKTTFETGEQLFAWWVQRKNVTRAPQEARLFE